MRVYTGGVKERDMAPAPEEEMMATTTSTRKVEDAGRLPSIEMEPKTLTLDQIKYAREAALYVVSTKTEEEAIRIFTAGLKPVQTKTVRKSSSFDSSDDDVDLDGGSSTDSRRNGGGSNKSGGQGRRPSFLDDVRDIATAPF